MSEWARSTYGDPCRQCGFRWTITREEAVATVEATPAQLTTLLGGADGSERHPDLTWSVAGYVCHVGDNLRIWAERLAALASGDGRNVARYDQDLLARARHYDEIALAGALWSLGRAAGDWADAVALADRAGGTLVHPDRGEQSVLDVVRSNAHDAWHHRWDIARTIEVSARS
ncbi:MAG TPA: DinB family protein [Acidimicrobiales bacterium]|nr:DinB family protein [Acidimicrobiales bacterium]